jgi:hypothetical protein
VTITLTREMALVLLELILCRLQDLSVMRVISCYFVLLCDNIRAIIDTYLWRYKGGRCDRHERTVTYRRGGSEKNPHDAAYRQEILERGSYSSYQDARWYMAGERVSSERLSCKADVPETRGKQITLSVAGIASISFHAVRCYALLALPCCLLYHSGQRG